MRAAPADPAATRNVPTGRQQLMAAIRLPTAAIDDITGPRACAINRFLHNVTDEAIYPCTTIKSWHRMRVSNKQSPV